MRHLQVTDDYKENFLIADATFRHQTVFDPFKKKLVPLLDPEITGTNLKFCRNAGEIFDHEKAYQVALGNIHPANFKQLINWFPSNATVSRIGTVLYFFLECVHLGFVWDMVWYLQKNYFTSRAEISI